jgi:hypothetical protein
LLTVLFKNHDARTASQIDMIPPLWQLLRRSLRIEFTAHKQPSIRKRLTDSVPRKTAN